MAGTNCAAAKRRRPAADSVADALRVSVSKTAAASVSSITVNSPTGYLLGSLIGTSLTPNSRRRADFGTVVERSLALEVTDAKRLGLRGERARRMVDRPP